MKTKRREITVILILSIYLSCGMAICSLADQSPAGFAGDAIQSGDKLNIQVYREQELSGFFTVSPSGKINYPLLGDVYVEGFTREELRDFLVENLGKEYIVNPQIEVVLEESPSKSVAILGQVAKPGNYILSPNLTLVRLISQVGGFTPEAVVNDVRIVRTSRDGKKSNIRVDVESYMKGKGEDVLLVPGDVVYVDMLEDKEKKEDLQNTVSILGQVAKPGNYKLVKGMTLVRLISEAGGFTALAAPNRVKLVRHSNNKREQWLINVRSIMGGQADDVKLESDDLVVVAESYI